MTRPELRASLAFLALLLLVVAFPACSASEIEFSSSDSLQDLLDEETNGDLDPDGDTVPLDLEITSHEDGATVTGNRTITLAGTLSGDVTAVTAVLNDGEPVSAALSGEDFSVELTLGDRENAITVTAHGEGDDSSEATLQLHYPFLAFANGQAATLVIGQPDFVSAGSGLSATQVGQMWGHPEVSNGMLFIPDHYNNRVLGYNRVPTTNGAAADFVLGQPDFETGTYARTQAGMNSPTSTSMGDDEMIIANQGRVLVYHSLPTTTGTEPDTVLGQPDFETNALDCTATAIGSLQSARVADGKILVPDEMHNRILIWNDFPTVNGAAAQLVLGQDDFTTCDGGTDASSLNTPNDVWSDGERILVLDGDNNRVLLWHSFPTENGQPADVVLGQADMTSAEWPGDMSRSRFAWASYLASNGNQIFVADCSNDRVLIWDSFPTENDVAPDRVLGSEDFESTPGGVSASTFGCPSGFAFHENTLLVSDENHSRVLIFEAP